MINARRKRFKKDSVESVGKSKAVLESEWNQHLLMATIYPISSHFNVVSRIFSSKYRSMASKKDSRTWLFQVMM